MTTRRIPPTIEEIRVEDSIRFREGSDPAAIIPDEQCGFYMRCQHHKGHAGNHAILEWYDLSRIDRIDSSGAVHLPGPSSEKEAKP